jgi:hypothetical protein
MLQTKIGRLQAMVDETEAKRAGTAVKIDQLASSER